MTKDQVIERLGSPQKTNLNGSLVWQVVVDDANYESLTVTFDPSGQIWSLSRGSHRSNPGRDSLVDREAAAQGLTARNSGIRPVPDAPTPDGSSAMMPLGVSR